METTTKKRTSKSVKTDTDKNYELKIGGVVLKLTNQDKIYWPDEGITKGELVDYYKEIAPVMLPYLKDRPESLNRHPNGIKGPSFFQKDQDVNKIPSWLKTERVYSDSNKNHIDYLVCNDKATLVYMANLGCIEINPWSSRIAKLDKPDWMVIDLDPHEIAFSEVIKAALATQKICDLMEIPCYPKTSGATGLHIYIPLGAKYEYEICRQFGQLVAHKVHALIPNISSIERMPSKRVHKVYLDFLQNSRGQTLAAPYSARPKPGATVSTPLDWQEVNARLDPSQFTIKTILKRIDKKGDLWKPVIGRGIDIDKAIRKLPEETGSLYG